ncbi:putative mitogen-activated protein kinase kinase kinase STE-STE11 family [Helianthus annuus]|nr:putative mitogen-activated protein kinase kinase kinase STE-STE11 family [Helianthus annuus]
MLKLDINCANILVDANGFVKLADFRLAKATALNDIKSCKETPYLMAPEIIFIFLNLLSDCIVYRLGMLYSAVLSYTAPLTGLVHRFYQDISKLGRPRKMVL